MSARLPWAWARMSAHLANAPTYGSSEWQALPDNSAVKVAAAILAAECWRVLGPPEVTTCPDCGRPAQHCAGDLHDAEQTIAALSGRQARSSHLAGLPTLRTFAGHVLDRATGEVRTAVERELVATYDRSYCGGPVRWEVAS